MSTAKRSQEQPRYTDTRRSRKRNLAAGAIIIGAVLMIISAALFFSGGGIGMGQGARFTKYLNEKYGQEFVVENVRVEGAGLGVQGSWRADAYPKSDPSLKFEIAKDQTTGNINFDSFLQVLWTEEGSKDVEAFLANQLPNNDGYHLRIMAGATKDKFYQSIQGETPTLAEMLEKHRDELSYNLIVRVAIPTSKEEPTNERLNEAFKVVSFAKEVGITRTYAGYTYRDPSFTEKDKVGQQLYQYAISVEDDDLRSLNTASELNKYFSKLR